MIITELELDGAKIIEPKIFSDNRGHSYESYSYKLYKENGLNYDFVLDYESVNLKKNTLRGIHFQNNPHPQTKLVRVLSGKIFDVIVDLRKDSPTFKKWSGNVISAENKKQILIPNGFGHAFLTLEDNTTVLYKFDDYYDNSLSRAIIWNDPDIAINWGEISPILSTSDANAVLLSESDLNFNMEINK